MVKNFISYSLQAKFEVFTRGSKTMFHALSTSNNPFKRFREVLRVSSDLENLEMSGKFDAGKKVREKSGLKETTKQECKIHFQPI